MAARIAVQEDERERQRGGRERPDVLGDPLIGIVDLGRLLEPEIGAPGEVAHGHAPGQPAPPEQAQPLLGEAIQDGDCRRRRKDADVQDGQPDEPRHVAIAQSPS